MENYALFIRSEFKKGDDIRDKDLKTPEDVIRYDNIPYGKDPQWQILDVYRPKKAEGKKLPVIVNVHGGGLVYGTKETYQFYCMSLARQGFAVVNYSYRLAPENKFPAGLEDCCSAFGWMLDHAEEYGFNTDYVFAVGDSAGGTLLGQFCNLCTNPEYAAKLPSCKVPKDFAPTAVALNCGDYKYELDKKDQNGALMPSLLPYVFENKGTQEEITLASVVGNVASGFPPAIVMTCEDDFLKWQMLMLEQDFMAHNVPFAAQYYVHPQIKLGHVFHCDIKMDIARFCNEEQLRFFRQFIKA